MKKMTRRTFLKGAAIAGVSLAVGGLYHKPIRRIADVLAALTPRAPQPLPAGEHAQVMSAAHSDDLDGMSVLYLAGTHYEMGYQHGTLMREKIHAFRQAAYAYITSLLQKENKWPDWLARLVTQPLLCWQAAAYWDTIPPEYLEEAQGIADGAGIHPLEVVLVTAIWEMYIAGVCS